MSDLVDKKLRVGDLSPDQRVVHDSIISWIDGGYSGDLLTTGGTAGSGKSSLIGVLADEKFASLRGPVAYVTFTGRASSIVRRKLKASGIETTNLLQASEDKNGDCRPIAGYSYSPLDPESDLPFCGTIHRLLYKPVVDTKTEEILGWTKRTRLDRGYALIVADECFHHRQRILTEDGWAEIGQVVNEQRRCRVWSRDKNGVLELKPIVRWLKHRAPKQLLRIKAGRTQSMRDARSIRCTPEHKIMTTAGYVRAEELVIGDRLVVRGRHLTSVQYSILMGSMLGDGSLNRNPIRNSPQVKLTQGEDQLEWLEFKRAIFGDLASPLRESRSGYNDKKIWNFTVAVTDQSSELPKWMPFTGFHPGGRRRWSPGDELLDKVDPLALAVWFLDDGSITRHRDGRLSCATIHSEGFDEADQHRIAKVLLEKFGLTCVPSAYRDYWCLRLYGTDAEALFEIIRPYVPACMAWKVPGAVDYAPGPQVAGELTVAEITSIEPDTDVSPFVYDIEVADNHNYIAGNIVVSNCSMIGDSLLADIQAHHVPLLAVGDHGQLPPVMDRGSLMENPMLRLEKIHRVAEGNPIIRLSRSIREERRLDRSLEDGDAIKFARRDSAGFALNEAYAAHDNPLDVGVVCWTNKNRVMLNGLARKAQGYADRLSRARSSSA